MGDQWIVGVVALVARLGAERARLDDLRAKEDMREFEAPADDAAVAEQLTNRFGCCAGGDVEVLGLAP